MHVIGAYGITVVNGEAFDAGVASMISPWTESVDDRWFYHTYVSTSFTFNANGPSFVNYAAPIDSKAMRKVEFGDVIVSIFESASSNGCSVHHNFRTLVKLH